MFNEFVFKLKKSKLLLGFAILCVIIFIVDMSAVIFDIIELTIVSSNSAKLSMAFLGFNIAVCIINIFAFTLIMVILIVKKIKPLNSSKNTQKR